VPGAASGETQVWWLQAGSCELRGAGLVGARRGVIAAVVRARGARRAFGRHEEGGNSRGS
jgi:hypothetical protein